jgi:hypothetical protein
MRLCVGLPPQLADEAEIENITVTTIMQCESGHCEASALLASSNEYLLCPLRWYRYRIVIGIIAIDFLAALSRFMLVCQLQWAHSEDLKFSIHLNSRLLSLVFSSSIQPSSPLLKSVQ